MQQIKNGSRTVATSKMECFVIIANDWKPLTILIMHSILDIATALLWCLTTYTSNLKQCISLFWNFWRSIFCPIEEAHRIRNGLNSENIQVFWRSSFLFYRWRLLNFLNLISWNIRRSNTKFSKLYSLNQRGAQSWILLLFCLRNGTADLLKQAGWRHIFGTVNNVQKFERCWVAAYISTWSDCYFPCSWVQWCCRAKI